MKTDMYFVCVVEFTPVFYGTEQECRESLGKADNRIIPEDTLREQTIDHTKIDELIAEYELLVR